MTKPRKCTTPKRDREAYKLTATDIRNLTALVKEANDILSYYINMPENRTAELEAADSEKFDILYNSVEDLKTTLGWVTMI